MAAAFICLACGTQFPDSKEPPADCAICTDSRQYVPKSGQTWTTLEKLRSTHRNTFQQIEPKLLGVASTPAFAIGQRALVLQTEGGNFLWDCISLLDEAAVEIIGALGGLQGIAISHPHYYSTMLEWSRAFGAPVYLHGADREWVMRPGKEIEFWDGAQKQLAPGLTLVQCGGHFAGGTVLHWADGAGGRGALCTGDVLQVTPDGLVSVMYSYPNLIPLPARAVRAVAEAVQPFAYDRIYGAFWERVIEGGASEAVEKSVERYLKAIE